MAIFKKALINSRKLILTLAVLFFLCYISVTSYAQERKYYGIVINPAIKHLELAPGESYSDKIELINDFQHQETIQYYPFAQNFNQEGESGHANFYLDDNLPDAINPSKWVSFNEESYIMPFSERISSNYTITVPTDASPGGYYVGLIYISSDPDKIDKSDESVALNSAISTLFFITVKGEINETGSLLQFSTDKDWYEFLPVTYNIRYYNEGSIHTSIGGNIFVHKGDITNPVDILEVNDEAGLALPGSIRAYSETQSGGFIYLDQEGDIKLNKDQFPKIYFGKYTATLKLKHPEAGERVTDDYEITFWVIPWRLILLAIILVGTGGLSMKLYKNRNPQ